MEVLDFTRLALAKAAFTTRRVPREVMRTLISANRRPEAGDLVLARVTELGHHKQVELVTGRKAAILAGDEVILAYGNRYAPDQFEAIIPDDLGPCHMVAAGGVASMALQWHDKIYGPTMIEPLGLLGDNFGIALNVRDFAIAASPGMPLPMAVFVFGTSMNAGKTTTVASLVRGLARAGQKVGALKITGTGAGNDLWAMVDAGAMLSLDFTDAGFATTYLAPVEEIVDGARRLLQALAAGGVEIAVVEVADGLLQTETGALVASKALRAMSAGVVFAAADSVGAVGGVKSLQAYGHIVLGVSGVMTRSPLARRESEAAGVPIYGIADLVDPELAPAAIIESIRLAAPSVSKIGA